MLLTLLKIIDLSISVMLLTKSLPKLLLKELNIICLTSFIPHKQLLFKEDILLLISSLLRKLFIALI
jgi:hypothetical protein